MSQVYEGLESLNRQVVNFTREVKKLSRLISTWNICSHYLILALQKNWILLAWLFAMLCDFSRSRILQGLEELDINYHRIDLKALAGTEAGLESEYLALQARRAELNEIISSEEGSTISRRLGKLTLSKYNLAVQDRDSHLADVPGSRLRRVAEFLFSPKVFSEVLEPALRDLFEEYCEALAENRLWKARWVRLRGYYSFWSAVASQLPISVAKMVYKIWKATR